MTYQEKLIWIAEQNPRVQPEELEKDIYHIAHRTALGWFLSEEEIADMIMSHIQSEKERSSYLIQQIQQSPVRSAAE